jgi:GNAT superfamily N-acetyltransferase
MQHFGIVGMKWGKHKAKEARPELKGLGPDKITRTTKYGEEITLTKDPPLAITKFLSRISTRFTQNYNQGAYLTIKDSAGKKVGDASIEKRGADELYLNWIGVNHSARGKGYASAVMKAAEEYGRTEGVKKMTLEVPGNAPDARHIYTKLGFKVTGEVNNGHKDSVWGGLTKMEYNFEEVKHMTDSNEFLAHYGVPGMKWGKHTKANSATSAPIKPSLDHQVAKSLKSKHLSELNNTELKFLTQRMQLEKQYKDLSPNTVSKGKQQVDKMLSNAEKANKVVKFIDSPAGKLIGKGLKTAFGLAVTAAAGAAGAKYAGGAAAPVVRQLAIGAAAPVVRQLAIGR